MPTLAHRQKARWGTGDIGFNDVNAGFWPRPGTGPATQQPCRAVSTVRDAKGGVRTRFSLERSIRHLHHQRRLSRVMRQTGLQKLFSRRSEPRRYRKPPWVRSAIGVRLAPRSLRQAPRFWARACRREPRDPGLPFRLSPGNPSSEPCSENKKPSGAIGSGGFTSSGF